jgi:2-polyprenyl-3-methyl-5-hydroxy-6-metoxy-1,4-benzoquinol methylase
MPGIGGAGGRIAVAICIPKFFGSTGVDIHQGNLDAELPFGDRSFDYVTCLEGLEHIENPQQAMREFARGAEARRPFDRQRPEHSQY